MLDGHALFPKALNEFDPFRRTQCGFAARGRHASLQSVATRRGRIASGNTTRSEGLTKSCRHDHQKIYNVAFELSQDSFRTIRVSIHSNTRWTAGSSSTVSLALTFVVGQGVCFSECF